MQLILTFSVISQIVKHLINYKNNPFWYILVLFALIIRRIWYVIVMVKMYSMGLHVISYLRMFFLVICNDNFLFIGLSLSLFISIFPYFCFYIRLSEIFFIFTCSLLCMYICQMKFLCFLSTPSLKCILALIYCRFTNMIMIMITMQINKNK